MQVFAPRISLLRVSAISKYAFEEREQSSRPAQQVESTIAVLDIGGMNKDVQQEAERVDQDLPLATLDLLAGVVARKIERRPPFCDAVAVCESMIATVGLASRPSCSRTAMCRSVMETFQGAVLVPELKLIVHSPHDVEDSVQHLAHIHRASPPALFGRRNYRLHNPPFGVGQVTRVTKGSSIRGAAVLRCSHRVLARESSARRGSTPSHPTQEVFGSALIIGHF